MSIEARLREAIFNDPTLAEVDRVVAILDLDEAFGEWWEVIEGDWQRQQWPTFKDMARGIFDLGFRHAVLCMVCEAEREKAAGA